MKRSEFRELIREVLIESLPEIIEIISEITEYNREETTTRSVVEATKPDISLLRSHVSQAVSRGYDELPDGPSRAVISNIPTPNNPKAIVNGEVFASGKGIMEWFAKGQGKLPPPTEFKHTEDAMGDFMKKRFGTK